MFTDKSTGFKMLCVAFFMLFVEDGVLNGQDKWIYGR